MLSTTSRSALAYLINHVPDRYCRMFQVLERLLAVGQLPVGKRDNFAAIDIGAGPGPGIFAIRSFYAALACYARLHDAEWAVMPLRRADIVEYSQAMPRVMRRFAQALFLLEQDQIGSLGTGLAGAYPCGEDLARSAFPLGEVFRDFSVFDAHHRHHDARLQRAEDLYRDDDLELSLEGARRLAYKEAPDLPSGYAMVSMMNFLTPGSDAFTRFSGSISQLMRGALIPGGMILVLGSGSEDYKGIYEKLDQRARAVGLTLMDGFDAWLPAVGRDDQKVMIAALVRRMWNMLEALAGDVRKTKEQLPAKLYDASKQYGFSAFRARVYRRGA
jgi:hypothetical protein